MAIVYLATDLKLDRQVAIKVLRPELAAAMGIDRFVREVELTSQLEHPNILSIFDAGEADGFLYYVMPVVEGESLRDRLNRDTQLPLDDAIQITKEIADALGHSHSKGIMHRDIKPENILLSGGRAVVADFGIARAVTMAGGEKLTQTGMAIGTPAYMSPEQAAGTGKVDHRTDIYALGCVLYEMLAGEAPYTGPSAQAIIAKGFSAPIPSVRRVRNAVSEDIDAAIEKALDKTPADRFESTEQFMDALTGERPVRTAASRSGDARWKRWAAAGVAAALVTAIALGLTLGRSGGVATADPIDPNSIVVLPFRNMSLDPEQEFMADGVAEGVLSLLTQIPELTVISWRTAFSFKGRDDLTLLEIASQLGVAHVLEGSLRRVGNTLRITAELIDPRLDANLFSGTFDRALDDIFAVQDEIAAKVVLELRGTLLGELPTLWETDPEAYAMFTHARHIADNVSQENYETAIPMFERVLEIDPDYAPAYVELAVAYVDQAWHGWLPAEERVQLATAAAERAVSLDPDFAYARATVGTVLLFQGDVAGGVRHLERALEMDPTDTEVLMLAGGVLHIFLGRVDEAIPFYEYVAARDPLYLVNLGNLSMAYASTGRFEEAISTSRAVLTLGPAVETELALAFIYYLMGRWEEAIATSRTALELEPSSLRTHGTVSLALLEMGDFEGALAEAELEPEPWLRLQGLTLANYALGRQIEFERAFQELQDMLREEGVEEVVAVAYAYMGDVDAAFEWLQGVSPDVGPSGGFGGRFDPLYANLHDDPRWAVWLEKGPDEELAAISFEPRLPR